ncbi:MAG: hypothetical protein FWH48_09290, partial [Oscillospiraceae bacterium]|nr:hypothetical protein [Oscillospiraceae bacterium]
SINADSYSHYGAIYKLNDDLIWLGDSLAALRVHDLLRLLDIIEKGNLSDMFESGDIEVYTHGRYSVYADIAKFLDRRIARVSSELPLESYAEFVQGEFYETHDIASVIVPGLLKHADLDELRRWSEA